MPEQTNNQQKFGLTAKKKINFSDWYHQAVQHGQLIDSYPVKGCHIFKPSTMHIWSIIKAYFNKQIKKLGVQEVYFPMLIPAEFIEAEQSHLTDFSPEVAWITRSGKTDIKPLAIRPTSETVIYPAFSRWIDSYRDLPLKVNQWCNVLRWEVKSTLPFIRNREFLWQEGHCAYATKKECDDEVLAILKLYADIYRKMLAVPVVQGRKSENEKFGGADYTLTLETFIKESGKAIQAATSHSLGTNFSRMFDVKADDYVWQSSWGFTTRSIGVMVMFHGDDTGVVLPPFVAYIQVIIVPCGKMDDKTLAYIDGIKKQLEDFYLVDIDSRDNVTSGYKFNYWEMKGIPLRIEVGKRDCLAGNFVLFRRADMNKQMHKVDDLVNVVKENLDYSHEYLYEKAKKKLKACMVKVFSFDDFIMKINENKMVLMEWCEEKECEVLIKEKTTIKGESGDVVVTGARSLCIPFEYQDELTGKCVHCGRKSKSYAFFGRCY